MSRYNFTDQSHIIFGAQKILSFSAKMQVVQAVGKVFMSTDPEAADRSMQAGAASGQVFLLLKDKEQALKATRLWGMSVPRTLHSSTCQVLKGELVTPIPPEENFSVSSSDGKPHNYRTVVRESPATFYDDDSGQNLAPVGANEYDVLAGVKMPSARYKIFMDDLLEWGTRLKVEDDVLVELPVKEGAASSEACPKVHAVVRYVGAVSPMPGIIFGVEIKDNKYFGWGTTHGNFQDTMYFHCKKNNGLFVSLDKLHPYHPLNAGATPHSPPPPNPVPRQRREQAQTTSAEKPVYQYKIGDRVVAFTKKNVAVHGTVKWVGMYSYKTKPSDKAVAVEMDVKLRSSEIEGLPKKDHFVSTGKDKSVIFLTEAEVLSEAAFKERPSPMPLSHVSDQQVMPCEKTGESKEEAAALAQAVGIRHTELLREDGEARKEMEERKRKEELAAIRKALPPEESLNLSGQESWLKEFNERQQMGGQPSQESWGNRERPRGKENVYEAVGSKSHGITLPPRRDHHYPGQQPPSDHHHHEALYNGSQHGVAPGTSQPAPHTQGSAWQHQQPPHTQGSAGPYQQPPRTQGSAGPYQQPPRTQGSAWQHQQPPHTQGSAGPPPHTQESGWPYPHHSQSTPSPSVSQWTQPPDFPAAATQRSSPQTGRHVAYAGDPSQSPSFLEVGSAVWLVQDPSRRGVVRWLGSLPEVKGAIAGVELDVPMEGCGDGERKGVRYFTSLPGRAFFCPVTSLQPQPQATPPVHHGTHKAENPLASVPLWEDADQTVSAGQILKYIGDRKGIQGHHNSCYLDATIFGLFALSDVFDSLFLDHMGSLTSLLTQTAASLQPQTPGTPTGLVQREIADMLWKGIVNPLRKYGVVRLDSVMGLRNKLEELGKMEGVSTAEKDPEEFLNMLFKHTLHVAPFIHIVRPSGTEPEYFVQLFVEFDKNLKVPTIDKLLLKMFREMKISFAEVPSKLLVQVPRYGKQFQTYKRIVPGIKLDTTPFLENHNSCECFVCGELAQVKCPECGMDDDFKPKEVLFCSQCNVQVHRKRARHRQEPIQGENEAVELELLSVLCIETSHYVCFSRDSDGRWLFFDSMADRVHDQFNIPRGVNCTAQLNEWVYEGDQERLMAAGPRELPELVRRFTQDVYMCVYIQADYGMYG